MSSALRAQRMSRDEFLLWAEMQEEHYEFDGVAPVAMTGALYGHSQICGNILMALRGRLDGSGCQVLGEAGVATTGNAVRYPDLLVTCSRVPPKSRLIPGVVAVFEVASPSDPARARVIKVREYLGVASIRTYVLVEQESVGMTVLEKQGDTAWTTTVLTGGDVLRLSTPPIELPVSEFYRGVEL